MIVCVIASQGAGSNYKTFKNSARPVLLRATIASLIGGVVPPNIICVSYNDNTDAGALAYEETAQMFVNRPGVIFLKQAEPQTQFQHIRHCIRHVCENVKLADDVHVLFMDDDDLLGKDVLQMFTKWYAGYTRKPVPTSHISDYVRTYFAGKGNDAENPVVEEPTDIATLASSMTCRPYYWKTNRVVFQNPDLHIWHREDHCDFPGTIVPLPIVIVMLAHLNWYSSAVADTVFTTCVPGIIKHSGIGDIVESMWYEDCVSPNTRLAYRE
jgi:hypothetical protein